MRNGVSRGQIGVLHILTTDDWGGTEVQVAELVARSRSHPARCAHAVAFLAFQGRIGPRLAQAGHEVHRLGGRGGYAGTIVRLARLLRARRPNVVEAYGFRAAMTARFAIALAAPRPRLLVGVRGLHIVESEDPRAKRTRAALLIERVFSRITAGYDCNSKGALDFLVSNGFPAHKLAVIPNGVEPVCSEQPPDDRYAARGGEMEVLCVARFVPRKQQDVLLRALAELSDLPLRCRFVGEGPTRGEMQALAARLGLDEAVEFCGRRQRDEVVEMLGTTDVFVLCSLWEGLPGSVLEAMTAGVPVVATDVSGTRELIDDGRTGLLIPSGDHKSLSRALRRVVAGEELRRRLGIAGWHEATTNYSYARLVESKNAYFELVAGS